MATRVLTNVIDDLDGTVIEHRYNGPIEFALDGVTYEIDLSDPNQTRLRDTMAKYMEAGRMVKADRTRGKARVVTRSKPEKKANGDTGGSKNEPPAKVQAPAVAVAAPDTDTPPQEPNPPAAEVVPAPPAPKAAPTTTKAVEAQMRQAIRQWAKGRTFNIGGKALIVNDRGTLPAWVIDLYLNEIGKQAPQPVEARVPAFSG